MSRSQKLTLTLKNKGRTTSSLLIYISESFRTRQKSPGCPLLAQLGAKHDEDRLSQLSTHRGAPSGLPLPSSSSFEHLRSPLTVPLLLSSTLRLPPLLSFSTLTDHKIKPNKNQTKYGHYLLIFKTNYCVFCSWFEKCHFIFFPKKNKKQTNFFLLFFFCALLLISPVSSSLPKDKRVPFAHLPWQICTPWAKFSHNRYILLACSVLHPSLLICHIWVDAAGGKVEMSIYT